MNTTRNVTQYVARFQQASKAKAEQYGHEMQARMDESHARTESFWASSRHVLSPATPLDYARWLAGYIRQGGELTHSYDYDLPRSFFVATGNLHLPALYGSRAVSVIVPRGVEVTFDEIGHNALYFMDDFRVEGSLVPLYSGLPLNEAQQ